MSETDSFIEEVTEEVRRDAMYGYARRYGWIAVVVILGIVGYTIWSELSKSRAETSARANGDAILSALEQDTPEARADALGALNFEGGADTLAKFGQAGQLVQSGDTDGALAIYDGLASGAHDPIYRDLAALRALVLRGTATPLAERKAALGQLAVAGAPFRPLAQEQLALVALEEADTEGALELFEALLLDSQSPQALRARAQQMIVALGGEVPPASQLLLGQ